MKKQLLSIALLSAVVSGAMAHEIGDKVYSNSAKWKITGKNLVTNGDFSDLSLSGWTAIDETVDKLTTFSVLAGQGHEGKNEIKVHFLIRKIKKNGEPYKDVNEAWGIDYFSLEKVTE